MGNTEYFELYEIPPNIQCPDCSSMLRSWHRILHLRQMHAAVGKESTVEQGYDVLSIPGYVVKKKKKPTQMEPEMDHPCGSACTANHMTC